MSKLSTVSEKKPLGRKPREFSRREYQEAFSSVFTPGAMELVAKKMLSLIKKGDREMIKYSYDRVLGRPGDSVDVTSDGKPVEVHMFLPKKNVKEE